MGELVPFRWRTGTNPDGYRILICDRGGGPDSPQPNDTWTITLEPADFKYDHDALETLAAMVDDLWPAALSIIQRLLDQWEPYPEVEPEAWEQVTYSVIGNPPEHTSEPMSHLERRVLDLLAPETTT